MKKIPLFLVAMLAIVLFVGCNNSGGSSDWAYQFVKWNGATYKTSGHNTSEYVIDDSKIGKEIGKVTKYSDDESANQSGNFSNDFEKGSKYFEIKEIDTSKAIAVERKDGKYIKAEKD